MADGNVYSLYPGDPVPGEADPDIVAWLEALLKDAKTGDIKAFAFVALREAGISKRWFKAGSRHSTATIGTLRLLEAEIVEDMLAQSRETWPEEGA